MKKIICALVLSSCLFFTPLAIASEKASTDWDSRIDLGLTLQEGNNDEFMSMTSFEATKKEMDNKLTLGAEYGYGEEDNSKESESVFVYEEFEQTIKNNLYATLNTSIEYDYLLDLERRVKIAPGVGVYLIKNAEAVCSVDANLGYIVEKYEGQALKDDIIPIVRQRLEQQLNENAKVFQEVCYYPTLDDKDDYRIEGEIELRTNLIDDLNLFVRIQDKYDNTPALTKKHNDIISTTGLSYDF